MCDHSWNKKKNKSNDGWGGERIRIFTAKLFQFDFYNTNHKIKFCKIILEHH